MKQIQLSVFEIADYALVSQDNKLSILGMFDRIYVQQIPAQHSNLTIVGVIEGEQNSDYSIQIQIHTPSGTNIAPAMEIKGKFGGNGRSNIIAGLNNLPLPEQGIYTIVCLSEGKAIGERELIVSLVHGTRGTSNGYESAKAVN